MQARKIPVLIVGGGPVGLALAADLGWRGVPCLLLWGDRDRTVSFPGEKALGQIMPAARLQVFPGEDHGIPMTKSAELNEALLRFLRETN